MKTLWPGKGWGGGGWGSEHLFLTRLAGFSLLPAARPRGERLGSRGTGEPRELAFVERRLLETSSARVSGPAPRFGRGGTAQSRILRRPGIRRERGGGEGSQRWTLDAA